MPELNIPSEELEPLDLMPIIEKVRAQTLKLLERTTPSTVLPLSRCVRMLSQLTTTQMRLVALRNGGNPFSELQNEFDEIIRSLTPPSQLTEHGIFHDND